MAMLSQLKRALRASALSVPPSDGEIQSWLTKSPALPQDVRDAFTRRGNPFHVGVAHPDATKPTRELVTAMNRANPDDKLSHRTMAELERLRRQKLGG